jgi:purine-binding chemotaxis protein CheW
VAASATETAVNSETLANQEASSMADLEEPTAEESIVNEMPAEPVEAIEPSAVMSMDGAEMPEPSPVEDEAPTTQAGAAATVDVHYLTLRVGSIKLAFARDEIDAIMPDAEIEPLRGAPEQVAGSVMHDGKRRMVLSLAPVVIGHAAVPQMQTVVMLGGGLWGVAGGEVVEDMVVNIDQVKWRSPMERHDVRPWLAGLSRADGVAIVDTAALRRALSGTS